MQSEMANVIIGNQIHEFKFPAFILISSRSLMAKTPGFHLGDKGSIPGIGLFRFLAMFFNSYQTLRPIFKSWANLGNQEAMFP